MSSLCSGLSANLGHYSVAVDKYLVMDWAEAAPGLFVFCAVLAYSRWRFVRVAADQKASTTLAMIAEALANS